MRPLITGRLTGIVMAIFLGVAVSSLVAMSVSRGAEGAAYMPGRDHRDDAKPASRVDVRQARPITKIELVLRTANTSGAGTDGDVFLGVGGREFFVDSQGDHDDFERGATRTYIFGSGATVNRPSENDPRSPWQLDFLDLALTPKYLRFEPGGDWHIGRVDLTVIYSGTPQVPGGSVHFQRFEGNANLWLGERRGKFVYFR